MSLHAARDARSTTSPAERVNGVPLAPIAGYVQAPFLAKPDHERWALRPVVEPPMDTPTSRPDRTPLKAVAALFVVNALAVYGQLAYALEHIAPTDWWVGARAVLSVGFAAAVESVALYVGWHAHDALLNKGYAAARRLRRCSYLIAGAVGAMNYAHFAAPGMRPTAASCAFGLLSLLSPWMWGLHTRRQQHLQLIKERKVDETGAEFSAERRRAFPIRTWQARRWSIDQNVADPIAAWRGYKADRARVERLARRASDPTENPTAQSVSRRVEHRLKTRLPNRLIRVTSRPENPTAEPTGIQGDIQGSDPTGSPTKNPNPDLNANLNGSRPNIRKSTPKHTPTSIRNAALLRERYGDRLTKTATAMRAEMGGWSHERITPAIAAHKAKADLTQPPNGVPK